MAFLPFLLSAEIKPAADAPQPLPPEESLKRFKLPPGFRIELTAAEPLLADPVDMCFDARGTVFVCELHGYNLDGDYDVQELNKTGVLDKTVRRIPASKEALERAERETHGTVKRLEDRDGDGRMDHATVWADDLPACYGLVPARDGVIVLCAPDVVYLGDRDGDGQAEVRETLFTGFGVGELWTRISNPRWGLDNWIYAANGHGSAGTIRGPRLVNPVKLGNTSFRFKADGSALEPVSGGSSGFGLAFTDFGDRFLISNQQHALYVAPLPYHYLARNPHYAAPGVLVNISTYGQPARVFPAAPPDPWRLARSELPEWVKFYGAAETTMGLVTAVCGPLVYRGDQFPPEFRDNHFSCESAYNLIHRCRLEPDGASFKAVRAGDENTEFLTSSEQWFRPVNLALGPDGTLYLVDMYREIIEDYSAIPRYLQQQYGLIAGYDRGRIWRVSHEAGAKPSRVDFAKATSAELVGELKHANAWRRETAQRLLVERGDKATVAALTVLLRDGPTPQARLHALHTLDGLRALEPPLVEAALADTQPGIRLHALRLADKWLAQRPALLDRALQLIDDADAKVRLQVAFTLGETRDVRKWPALAALAARFGGDRWMQAAIISSVADAPVRLLRELLQDNAAAPARNLVTPLAAVVGARQQSAEIGELLAVVASFAPDNAPAVQALALRGLSDGLKRGKPPELTTPDGQSALRRLLASASSDVRRLALQVAGQVKLQPSPEMLAAFNDAAKDALDAARSLEERKTALALLTSAPFATLEPVAKKLLDARQPLDLQLAALAALAATDESTVGPTLLAGWSTYSPKVQAAALDAMFRRQQRLTALLDALESGTVARASLDTLRREQLLALPDEAIRRRAAALLRAPAPDPNQQQLFARYQDALAGPRDAQRGKKFFDQKCARCHNLQGQAGKGRPNLAGTKGRAEETLLQDILQPSAQLTAGFRSYTVVTRNDDLFTGILAAETATSITLPGEDGVERTILRADIESMQTSDVSLMPENLTELLQPQDVADLLGYLREALAGAPAAVVTLFDDEHAFAEQLTEGDGTATLVTDDRHCGTAALRVTPPQRFSPRLPGWEYRIAENPQPGEFRYLRFAWKSSQAQGIMIELAADGQWPPAGEPLRRYYCGKNTTGWQAREVSPDVAREWTVVTVDLWQDCGAFTLTGFAPTAMSGPALFDCIQLLRTP